MSIKLLKGLAPLLAVAALAVAPGAAQAELNFFINGVKSGPTHSNATQFGTLTLTNPIFGEFQCKVIVGAPVWNELGKGFSAYEGWEPFVCSKGGCTQGTSFITAENPVKLVTRENSAKEIINEAVRGTSSLPWPAELTTPETERRALRIPHVEMLINCPSEIFESRWEGELIPKVVNGAKNGLHPTKLEFEGAGGKTGHLKTKLVCGGECSESELQVKGELFVTGNSQQLITGE
jgi:hypothetical protein